MARQPSFPEHPATSAALVRSAAARWGDEELAVLGERRLTYAQADAQSAAMAKGLLASGVGKGTRVALLAGNSPDWILGWLAATRIGAVTTLLNTYSKAAELGWLLRHSDTQVLLIVDGLLGHDYLERLEAAVPGLAGEAHEDILLESHPYLRTIWTWGEGRRAWCGPVADLDARGAEVPDALLAACEAEVTPADPMVVVYSSGSTSDPKGAIHSHGAVIRHSHNLLRLRDLDEHDVVYTPMPLFWVGGFSYSLLAAMHAGASLVFEEQFEPGATLALIERERVTQVLGWPHMAKALLDHPDFATRDLSSVRGGTLAALPKDAKPGDNPPKASSLGMTETLGPHSFPGYQDPLPDDLDGIFGLVVPGVERRIVDPVTLEDAAPGESGEVWVRGYSLMLGLHKRERADTFTPDGWYRTGDAGWEDQDGQLHFTGRMGDLIKSSGMNITPRDVELVLEALPEVSLAFVTGVPHPDRGEDVVAAIALSPGASLGEDEARARVKDAIASYKVPRHIAVYADQSELPWLDSGKVDRRRLAADLEVRFGGDGQD
jgi:acyl-CoA synthetase (AMP-forming)/AMP-acid ligase II